jgi:alpha-1,2-mannosyltransferase
MPMADLVHRLPRISERGLLALLLVGLAAVSIQYTIKALDERSGKQDRSAILRWRDQLLRLDGGENIYERDRYPNPPIMALLLRPLADLPPVAGALAWYYLKVGMVLAAFAMTFRLIEDTGRSFPVWAKALTVVVSLRPIVGDLTHGNVNLFILFLVVAALAAFQRDWDLTAGIVLALAIACKVTPALFVVYFAWKRAWRLLAGVAFGLGLFVIVIPSAVLGWQNNAEMLASWCDHMVMPFLAGGAITSEHQNQSLPGLIVRLLTASPSFSDYDGTAYVPTQFHNFATLGTSSAAWLVKAAIATLLAIGAWCCRTPTRPRANAALAAEYALVLLGMLLFSERTWKHHCVTLMVPLAVVCYAAARAVGARRVFLFCSLFLVQVLFLATSTGLWPDAWAKLAEVYGAYTAGFLLLASAVAFVIVRDSNHGCTSTDDATNLTMFRTPIDAGESALRRGHVDVIRIAARIRASRPD